MLLFSKYSSDGINFFRLVILDYFKESNTICSSLSSHGICPEQKQAYDIFIQISTQVFAVFEFCPGETCKSVINNRTVALKGHNAPKSKQRLQTELTQGNESCASTKQHATHKQPAARAIIGCNLARFAFLRF